MELKNSKESYEALNSCVAAYYRAKNESCLTLGAPKIEISVFDNKEYQDTYVQKFFVKRKYFILICIPIDTRNFYAGISLGVGADYAPMNWLVSEDSTSKFSMESTTEAVVHNLAMLDEYLAGRLK